MEKDEVVAGQAKCECGQTLPWHLFELGLGVKHTCLCERTYEERGGVVRFVGIESNPFTKKKEW